MPCRLRPTIVTLFLLAGCRVPRHAQPPPSGARAQAIIHTMTGTAGGEIHGYFCTVDFDSSPNHTLTVTEAGPGVLSVSAPHIDTALMVRGSSGEQMCNVARSSLWDPSPLLAGDFAVGTYQIFVRARSRDEVGAPYHLTATLFPDSGYTDTGPQGVLTASPSRATGVAGGPRSAPQTHGGGCPGWIDTSADHILHVDADTNLVLHAQAPGHDTTLVVVGPEGARWCADDTHLEDLNPTLTGFFSPGRYEVFVGSYDAEASPPYTITATPIDETGTDPSARHRLLDAHIARELQRLIEAEAADPQGSPQPHWLEVEPTISSDAHPLLSSQIARLTSIGENKLREWALGPSQLWFARHWLREALGLARHPEAGIERELIERIETALTQVELRLESQLTIHQRHYDLAMSRENWPGARRWLRAITALIPDETDPRHLQALEDLRSLEQP